MLNINIIEDVISAFHNACVEEVAKACVKLKLENKITYDWGEENITANIVTYINNSPTANEKNIFVSCEVPEYNNKILSNQNKAKSASRLDMRLSVFVSNKKTHFSVEAKNLIEDDITKSANTSKTFANSLHKRYVETGIDHYISKHYPMPGCMLGYILDGSAEGTVGKINMYLCSINRDSECLSLSSTIEEIVQIYSSYHNVIENLNHLMIVF